MDAGAHGAELESEGGRDLLVGEPLDVAQDDSGTKVGREGVERALHVVVELGVEYDLLGASGRGGQARVGIVGERVEADALLSTHAVEEEVRRDAVQPALEGSRPVGAQGVEHADEDVVREVLGVVNIAREAVGQAVDARAVLGDDLLPRRRSPAFGCPFGHDDARAGVDWVNRVADRVRHLASHLMSSPVERVDTAWFLYSS